MMAVDGMNSVMLNCFVCNSRLGLSARNIINIFETRLDSNRDLAYVISQVLDTPIEESSIHSTVLCKKCFKLFCALDELEQRATETRARLIASYELSMKKMQQQLTLQNEDQESAFINLMAVNEVNQVDGEDNTAAHTLDEEILESDIVITLNENHLHQNCDTGTNDVEEQTPDVSSSFVVVKAEIVSDAERNEPKRGVSYVEPDAPLDSGSSECVVPIMNNSETKQVKVETSSKAALRRGDLYVCLLCESNDEPTPSDEPAASTLSSFTTTDAKALNAHVRNVHQIRLYICDVCAADFRKRNELSAHMDAHVAAETGDFQCEVCNRIFGNLRLYRIHRRTHQKNPKAYACVECGKRYGSRQLLEDHMNVHKGVRPFVCNVCGKGFANRNAFKAHNKTHADRPRPYQCPVCKKSFLNQQNLNTHKITHNAIKPYKCHLCQKGFNSSHNLDVHSTVHTGYKPYPCTICGKMFARKAETRDHERTHTGERPYQCELCGATFSQRSNLQSHKRATHYDDKRYNCDLCSKAFKRRRLLEYHIQAAHTGERPYRCDHAGCGAAFVYPEHFKKHLRTHSGERPYSCEVCGKAFTSRDNRNAHRYVHSDKKPYECLMCSAGFMRKPQLYQHMESQGHVNDAIVINQPRLTNDANQLLTVNNNGDVILMEGQQLSRLELVSENELVVASMDELPNEDELDYETADNDSQQIIFDVTDGVIEEEDEVEEGMGDDETIVEERVETELPIFMNAPLKFAQLPDGVQLMDEEMVLGADTKIFAADGMHLVKVRVANEDGNDEEAWIKIVNG